MENDKSGKIMWAFCLIPLFVGIILLDAATSKLEYSTDEYWVAKDYHHVYDKKSGEIVNYISENEKCSIDGDIITVTTIDSTLLAWGAGITAFFGMATIGMVWGEISTSEWWRDFCNKL